MLIKYKEEMIRPWEAWIDPWVYTYLRWRYGSVWTWYWLNWQTNRELLY